MIEAPTPRFVGHYDGSEYYLLPIFLLILLCFLWFFFSSLFSVYSVVTISFDPDRS